MYFRPVAEKAFEAASGETKRVVPVDKEKFESLLDQVRELHRMAYEVTRERGSCTGSSSARLVADALAPKRLVTGKAAAGGLWWEECPTSRERPARRSGRTLSYSAPISLWAKGRPEPYRTRPGPWRTPTPAMRSLDVRGVGEAAAGGRCVVPGREASARRSHRQPYKEREAPDDPEPLNQSPQNRAANLIVFRRGGQCQTLDF